MSGHANEEIDVSAEGRSDLVRVDDRGSQASVGELFVSRFSKPKGLPNRVMHFDFAAT